jgi:hypothetical protein
MATLADVRDAAELRLGDTSNNYWTAASLEALVKEGQDDLVRRTGCLWLRDNPAGLVPAASTGTYTLPTNLLLIERLTWQSKRMVPLTRREAERIDPLYRTTEGDPVAYIVEGDGLTSIRYYRVPADDGAATDIYIEYQRRAATLSSGGTSLDLPDRYCDYVRHYVMWLAYERDGPGQNLKMAEHYRQRYVLGIDRMLKRKSAIHSARIQRLGGSEKPRTLGYPRLPWQYGQRVR